MSRPQAFFIEAEAEAGIAIAQKWVEKELGIPVENNPDVVVVQYGLFSVTAARGIPELAAGAPFAGEHKILIITAHRAYHEAQNALLKIFEEPPTGTYLFLVLPTLGNLLPTLRSRVQVLSAMSDLRGPTFDVGPRRSDIPELAQEFLKANKEKRSAIIKRLTSGKDEEKRRLMREEAIALVNGIEAVTYEQFQNSSKVMPQKLGGHASLLRDIAVLRGHLYDRSAPVRMILEHLSLSIPKDLV